MPRNTSVELLYLPLIEEAKEKGAAKEVMGGYKEIAYNIDEPLEPILFTLYLPKVTVKKTVTIATFFIVDTTVAAKPQIIAEGSTENQSAGAGATTGPFILCRRVIPERDFTEEPAKQGRRTFSIEVEAAAESITVPANTAKTVAYVKIDGLARQ